MILKEGDPTFNPHTEAAGCFCCSDGRFLLLFRIPTKPQPNTYGLPGGKVEPSDESIEATIRREVLEETRFVFVDDKIKYLGVVSVRYDNGDFIYHVFRGDVANPNDLVIDENEHSNYQWVTPEEAKKLSLIEDLDIGIDMFYKE